MKETSEAFTPALQQHIPERKAEPGGQGVHRQRPAFQVRDRAILRCGHESKQATINSHDGDKIGNRADLCRALTGMVSKDVVEGGDDHRVASFHQSLELVE